MNLDVERAKRVIEAEKAEKVKDAIVEEALKNERETPEQTVVTTAETTADAITVTYEAKDATPETKEEGKE